MHDDDIPLPGVLGEIEHAVDRETAIAVMNAFGGTMCSLPSPRLLEQNPASYRRNRLVRLIGLDATLRLCKAIAPTGGNIEIPLGRAVRRAIFLNWVTFYHDKFSAGEIARRLGVTRRTIVRTKALLRRQGLIAQTHPHAQRFKQKKDSP